LPTKLQNALLLTVALFYEIGIRFDVLTPVKDGISDLFDAKVFYEENGLQGETPFASGADVVPVPEPLTIFGTATAFGCGVLFKRKFSKKTVS